MKIANFFLRNEINQNNYETERCQNKKQETVQGKTKWSVFSKDYYEILPLNLPSRPGAKKNISAISAAKNSKTDQKSQMGALFREHITQKTNTKTNASNVSKLSKMITLKTETVPIVSNSDLKSRCGRLREEDKGHAEVNIKPYWEN